MRFKKYLITFVLILSFLFVSAGVVLAQDSGGAMINSPVLLNSQTDAFEAGAGFDADGSASVSIGNLAAQIIGALLSLLGIIFIGLMVYAGYNWMTAGGDEDKITTAKRTISRALIGLVITLSAYAITYFVFNNFFTGEYSGSGGTGTVQYQ